MIRPKGAALLWVLWVLMLGSALLAYGIASTARTQAYASIARQQSQMQAAAEAGLQAVIFQLHAMRPATLAWLKSGGQKAWQYNDVQLTIQVRDETGKIDLLGASNAVLQSYFVVQGVAEAEARTMANAVVMLRSAQSIGQAGALQHVQKLSLLPGFSPARLKLFSSDFTVFTGRLQPEALWASPAVRAAMQVVDLNGAVPSGLHSIHVQATAKGKPSVWLTVVIQISPADAAGHPYRVLSWQRGIGKE